MEGSVEAVLLKKERGVPTVAPACQSIHLIAGSGIKDDLNANIVSPRQVLITSSKTLRRYNFKPGDLRENIVIGGTLDVNKLPSGSLLQLGEDALVRLTFPCETCKTLSSLPISSLSLLEEKRGMLGVVVQSGLVKLNDPVSLLAKSYPPILKVPYQRFLWFIRQVPSGRVVTYKQIIVAIGATPSYARAIPGYIKRAVLENVPLHRIVASNGNLIPHIFQQSFLLEAEGVKVNFDSVDLDIYGWDIPFLYS